MIPDKSPDAQSVGGNVKCKLNYCVALFLYFSLHSNLLFEDNTLKLKIHKGKG